ncbi:hypothetical protein [Lichenicoccus roseus]|uniref:hypothetical protein n=1 Tax=Lichenicoccus roseus TaxID=2683649 RepID=UPI001486FD07|nr:hypothetical protein [Lichenicoccus roseus]
MTDVHPDALVVLHAFGPYFRGQLLTDPAVIAAILGGGNASLVVRTRLPQPSPVQAE